MTGYSETWFDVFARPIPEGQTRREVDFLARILPLPSHPRVLDVACGTGRHAREMGRRGYVVTAVDASAARIAENAARGDARVGYATADMHDLAAALAPARFDAVICLWQSFGIRVPGEAEAEDRALLGMVARLRDGGRLVLDVYHRGFFAEKLGERAFDRGGVRGIERKSMSGDRLTVRLEYEGRSGLPDEFTWRVFTPDELVRHAGRHGLAPIVACSEFDERSRPSAGTPRMQFVFGKS
jgi:SAM-dependent methyltransferase